MCVINSMTSRQGAHEQGQYLLHSSYSPRGTIVHPAIGSWVVRLKGRQNTTLPGFASPSLMRYYDILRCSLIFAPAIWQVWHLL